MNSQKFYDEISDSYSELFLKRIKYNNAVDDYIRNYLKIETAKNILDIGSGNGERITRLVPKSTKITSVEDSARMCTRLRSNREIEKVIECDAANLKITDFDEHFDAITMQWNVLGHIQDPSKLLNLLFKILNLGGCLIFDVNNPLNVRYYGINSLISNLIHFNLYPRYKRRAFQLSMGELTTPVSFSPPSFYRSLLKDCGFTKVEFSYLDYETGNPASFLTGQILITAFK